jgi:SNF2 family DNA or RNA helicase
VIEIPPFFAHQLVTLEKCGDKKAFFDISEPGTAKTRVWIEEFWRRRQQGAGPGLVLAPKSILKTGWAADITKYAPGMTYSIAYASNREKAFKVKADMYLTNWDALSWLNVNRKYLAGFSTLLGDESTAVKNPQAQRTKACMSLARLFEYVRLLTGTPNPNSIIELWAQMMVLDGGERLGSSYYKFRNATCEPVQIGPMPNHLDWVQKPGAEAAVFDLIGEISIRHELDKCLDMPERIMRTLEIDLPTSLQKHYDAMEEHGLLELDDEEILAPQKAAIINKLLQIASGVVYGAGGASHELDDGRAELIMDLIEERAQCLVAFNWKHQRNTLLDAAKKRGFTFGVIDGEAGPNYRNQTVEQFQAGKLRVIFAQPQSAGHGLTLTAGTTTIWTSPVWSSELWEQFNRRIYRAGQKKRTETIRIQAKGTVESRVYEVLESKVQGMDAFRTLLNAA